MNNTFLRFLVFLFFISTPFLSAQTDNKESQNIIQTIGSDIQTAVVDGFHLLISPTKFSNKDLLLTGGAVLSTGAIMPFDEDVRKYAKRNHSDFNDKIMDAGKAYGNVLSPIIIGGSIYSYGLFLKNENVRTTGRMVIESVVYAGAITTVIKTLFGRSRPFVEDGNHFYKFMQFNNDHTSFPSGHSTIAFAISSVLSNRINNTYASICLYTIAGLTSVSRVYHDDHWASDVFLGSAIGYFVGNFISKNSGILYTDKNKKVTLILQPTLSGLNCNLRF